ncbi:uncharacterized protein LOC141902100 [Tubulanus polymorphus]|uniref:uncharacterized protein LOC141902100 n=1 Tax=Tubulanus polymorphus TaxID=672921 RepID=UPI003DA403C3
MDVTKIQKRESMGSRQQDRVTPAAVVAMLDTDLTSMGVTRMGDRALLKARRGKLYLHQKKDPKNKSAMMKLTFFCLGNPDCMVIPHDRESRISLIQSGLGEKTLEIEKDSTFIELRGKLFEVFPQLSTGGGFEFLAARANKMLELLDIESSSITPYALKSLVARGKIYIRPIQREILSQTTPKAESVKEKCLKCDQEFPLSLLREHTESCDGLIDDLPKISNAAAAAAAVAAVKRSISSVCIACNIHVHCNKMFQIAGNNSLLCLL